MTEWVRASRAFLPLVLAGCGLFPSLHTSTQTPTPVVVPLAFHPDRYYEPVVGQPFAMQLSAVGGLPAYLWKVTEGALPKGLALATNGLLSGTPTQGGAYSFSVSVDDTRGASSGGIFSGTVATSGTITFRISMPALPAFGVSQDFGFEPFFEGGTPPYACAVTGLPPGISYDPETCTLFGQPTETGTFSISIALKDATGAVAQGSPVSASLSVQAPQVAGGGGGGGGGFDCSPYDDSVPAGSQYAGQFAYDWIDNSTKPPQQGSGSFRLSLDVQCLAVANGSVTMTIIAVNASDAYFGTLGSVTPKQGSVMLMPTDPPTSPSNQAQPGQGIEILFPNGAVLGTSNDTAGDLTVLGPTTPFKIISNGPAPAWSVVNTTTGTSFAPASNPNATVTAKSWNLDHN